MSTTVTQEHIRAAQSALTRGVTADSIVNTVAWAIADTEAAGKARGMERGRRKLYEEVATCLRIGGFARAADVVVKMGAEEFP